VLGSYASLLAFPAYLANGSIILIAQVASALPGASLVLPAFPFAFAVLMYAALIAIAAYRLAVLKRSSMTDQLRLSKKAST
jgi:membrane protein implicated in regulation of membrane protease activity